VQVAPHPHANPYDDVDANRDHHPDADGHAHDHAGSLRDRQYGSFGRHVPSASRAVQVPGDPNGHPDDEPDTHGDDESDAHGDGHDGAVRLCDGIGWVWRRLFGGWWLRVRLFTDVDGDGHAHGDHDGNPDGDDDSHADGHSDADGNDYRDGNADRDV